MRLCCQVVDLVWLDLGEQRGHPGSVHQFAVVQEQLDVRPVRVDVEVLETAGIKGGCAPDDAVHVVTLVEQELREV